MFKIVQTPIFDYFITLCIFLNTIVMASKYYMMSEQFENSLEIANYVFAAIFNLEAAVKILGLGSRYFYDSWNRFDLLIVIGTDIGLLMNSIDSKVDISTAATVVRGFRIMRVFRLIRSARNIRIILDTLVNILPQITNIMSLIFLLFFIYSALGINLFSGVKHGDQITDKNNFMNFWNALLVLMRCATGESWNEIMAELANKEDCIVSCFCVKLIGKLNI